MSQTTYVIMQCTEPFVSRNTGTCKMQITIQILDYFRNYMKCMKH